MELTLSDVDRWLAEDVGDGDVTSLAVIDIADGRFVLREKLPGMSLEELQSVTGGKLHLDGDVADLIVPEL
jgi:3-oxoadipate CoA-transferase, beta subunit